MKFRSGNRSEADRAVALVITLIMLAMVTVMTIVFLAMARRERAGVKVQEDMDMAKMASFTGLERAKVEAIAEMAAGGSKLNYDLFVSTNFQRKGGYDPAIKKFDSNNVSYVYQNGNPLTGDDYLRMLGNLQYDPRAPVFVPTNDNGGMEFRFYLDFNRNRQFETNGYLATYNTNGSTINPDPRTWVKYIGDPEWIAIPERPGMPHSETNRFIARYAYLVLPAGKTLDLNFIHNQVMPGADDNLQTTPGRNGFVRNQGYGSWEINLAAFLRELNTNVWLPNSYANYNPGVANSYPRGAAFDDARAILDFRYIHSRNNLAPGVHTLLPNPIPISLFALASNGIVREFKSDLIDNFGDGPTVYVGTVQDNDDATTRPWPGSINTNAFTDVQQLFSLGDPKVASTGFRGFETRLTNATARSKSSYDRYSLYNLLAQMGVDSTPATKGRLHLNYENAVGYVTNNYQPWTNAVRFFTNAADLMLHASMEPRLFTTANRRTFSGMFIGDTRVRTNFSVTNILFYSVPVTNRYPVTNPPPVTTEYTAATRRILQVAANIFDNMTNNGARYPYFPTVFRPVFSKNSTNIFITGFLEATNSDFLTLPWTDPAEWLRTNKSVVRAVSNINIYGEPVIIGAKKGHPNFNELALESNIEISRKLQLAKPQSGGSVKTTNEMFLVSLTNRWGIEGWNSYSNAYPYPLRMHADIQSILSVSNITLLGTLSATNRVLGLVTNTAVANTSITKWVGTTNKNNYAVFIDQTFPILHDQPFAQSKFFLATPARYFTPEPAPQFQLYTTNQVRFWLTEPRSGRLVDFVSFYDLVTFTDLRRSLYTPPGASTGNSQFGNTNLFNDDALWDPTPTNGLNKGILYQIAVSEGEVPIPDATWKSYRLSADKKDGTNKFRAFMGLRSQEPPPEGPQMQAPFTPTRPIRESFAWQVNDPLVHYMPSDLRFPKSAGAPQKLTPGTQVTNTWNIGAPNIEIYRPWGGGLSQTAPDLAFNMGIEDPGVRSSDDWRFPITETTNKFFRFPSVGWLGRVHRGTPWQTIYLKSFYALEVDGKTRKTNIVFKPSPPTWVDWSGSAGTFPHQDYKLLDVFTVAPNENAARGLLSVNQAHRAAWSAVLSGVPVVTNVLSDGEAFIDTNAVYRANAFKPMFIEPATPQIETIVDAINFYRANQQVITNTSNPAIPYALVTRTDSHGVFEHVADILGAPALTYNSPYLRLWKSAAQRQGGMIDEVVERIPQEILSLLQRDEPRFVVYSFGQSLKPAPRSLSTSADFYNICTNYQITGEAITKTTFRVEGDLHDPDNPVRTVVEDYRVLPPPE
jgi:hypothetical protein